MQDKHLVKNVTDADLGCWIEGASVRNPVEFSVAIVELARHNGLEMDDEAWDADIPIFLRQVDEPELTYDMLEDLGFVTDAALDFLNENLPDGYYFDFEDGLYLFREQDEEDADEEVTEE